MFFSFMTPNRSHSVSSGSEMSSKGRPILALKFWCDLMLSRETPAMIALAPVNRVEVKYYCLAFLGRKPEWTAGGAGLEILDVGKRHVNGWEN
jgi:hypothetical protein